MLLDKEVEMRWNSKNKKYYEDLGYTYTKMGDAFIIKTTDLKPGSAVRVKFRCDYCGREYETGWRTHLQSNKNVDKDCCSNPECTTKKAREGIIAKYGTDNIFDVEEIRNRQIKTNIERYGCANPFGSKEIIQKIRQTNLKKYGCEVPTQNPEILEKTKATCLSKYGVPWYVMKYTGEEFRGAGSPKWKGGVEYHRVERSTFEYHEWRKAVFERDFYTCQCCGARNGNGKSIHLSAHHIYNWKDNEDKRYDVNNGITLCQKCHNKFHSLYSKRNNTPEQLEEFLKNQNGNEIDEKIC